MIDGVFVLELMKFYSEKPETFPRVLSAFVRREMLTLRKMADEARGLIDGETQVSRGKYLGEHLEDLAGIIESREEFLEYFRDIPLAKDSDGEITTGEIVRLVLEEYRNELMKVREDVRRGNWGLISEEEFSEIKKQALKAADSTLAQLEDLDASLGLAWPKINLEGGILDDTNGN